MWTTEQQTKYIEYKVRGGPGFDVLYFNHPGWGGSYIGDFVLVDGLQRLTAIRKFLNNKLPVFSGYFLDDFEDKRILLRSIKIKFSVNSLKTRAEVLTWYIEMNSGGLVHTDEEIQRVKNLLEKEQNGK